MSSPDRTIPELVHWASEQRRPKAGLRFVDRRERATFVTWSAYRERSLRAADTLRRQGVVAGDRVVIILPTRAEFFDAWLGSLALGEVEQVGVVRHMCQPLAVRAALQGRVEHGRAPGLSHHINEPARQERCSSTV